MNWILGLIGAFFGLAISDEHWLLGLVSGFFAMFLLSATMRLRLRVDVLEKSLQALRTQVTETSSRLPPMMVTRPAASTAATGEPQQAAWPQDAVAPATTAPSPTPSAAEAASAAAQPRAPQPAAMPEAASVRAPASAAPSAAESATPAIAHRASAPPPLLQPPPRPREGTPARPPRQPGIVDRLVATITRWFTEGNVPVKVGVLVFFVGIAAALRYAAEQGYLTVPIEVRLALIAATGIVGLAIGWRQRALRPVFGLSLQGGGLGVLLMTVFAAYRLYGLLPPMAAFALVVVLVAGSALLAVLQDAIALAALGFLGGYLAPVLIATGSHDHVALFSYYAVLNAAVFAVSWKRSWRLLNLIGFFFTFGVGTAWGVQFYRPELFASVEPFLILFFAFYLAIGLLYVLRQTEHRRPWVDGTLVFGTPLLAFPLQAGLLKDDRLALAYSALAVAAIYAGLVRWLRRRPEQRLLTEAYAVMALAFATLAVPLAFSAGTTASVWALEGAGAAWLGIRQGRRFPWLAGLALQALAAGAYVVGLADGDRPHDAARWLLLNPTALGALLIGVAGFALAFVHDRWKPIRLLPALLFAWAACWWLFAGGTQIDLAAQRAIGGWRFAMVYLAGSIAVAAAVGAWLAWPRMRRMIAVCALLALPALLAHGGHANGPLAPANLGAWAAYALAVGWALWNERGAASRSLAATHLLALWTLVLAACMQAGHLAHSAWHLGAGWHAALALAPLLLASYGLWRRPGLLAWPRAEPFAGYRAGWFAPAAVIGVLYFLLGLFAEGSARPLAWVPVINPLELSLLAVAAMLYGGCEGTTQPLRKAWPLVGFALLTSVTLRAVHHLHGEPWSLAVFDSAVSQMALTVVWSLVGVAAWITGSRCGQRRLWMGGALLMGVVLLKLIAVDRHYMGDLPGIASFVVVGLLMMGVGYLAPAPPKATDPVPEEPTA